MLNNEFQFDCPICGRIRYYPDKYRLKYALLKNQCCIFCSRVGKYTRSDEQKKKQSMRMSGEKHPNYGHRGILSPCFGKPGHNKGKKFSEEYCKKLSDSHKGKTWKKETRQKFSESKKGEKNHFFGKYHTEEAKKKMSVASKFHWENPITRKKFYNALEKTKWLKVRTDIGQLEMINRWNKIGFNFEPNYQIHTDSDLFYIDGYDPIHNVVLEYDGEYHNSKRQKEKDLVRQHKIIEILHPKKFWRYNKKDKIWRNVI